ncbi:unnamed protein product [Caenorhabditis angaria]|uniref:Uncharacterized protein n=1 Tax=Caenorhabditis angaria TaxID=860376 RepID=A0A9P1N837_9PELO|nr:unnamed protein product [Caenorhabditis angaria]
MENKVLESNAAELEIESQLLNGLKMKLKSLNLEETVRELVYAPSDASELAYHSCHPRFSLAEKLKILDLLFLISWKNTEDNIPIPMRKQMIENRWKTTPQDELAKDFGKIASTISYQLVRCYAEKAIHMQLKRISVFCDLNENIVKRLCPSYNRDPYTTIEILQSIEKGTHLEDVVDKLRLTEKKLIPEQKGIKGEVKDAFEILHGNHPLFRKFIESLETRPEGNMKQLFKNLKISKRIRKFNGMQ